MAVTTACQTITAALNKVTSGDTIIVAAGIYTENITLDNELTLQGAGDRLTIIDGNAISRVLTITAGSVVTITDITITNGIGTNGGGINNEGVLTLNNSTVISNRTYRGADDLLAGGDSSLGGGIYNTGTLELNYSRVISNKTGDGGDGLDIVLSRGGNSGYGGGIYNLGTLKLNSSVVNHNATGDGGNGYSVFPGGGGGRSGDAGGIFNLGILDIHNSFVLSNSTGAGGLDLSSSGHDGRRGRGGGIVSSGIGGEVMTLSNSSVSYNNGGSGGGIIHTHGKLAIDNSSISGNISDSSGGGIFVGGVVTITNSTINDNVSAFHGGGIEESTNITSEVTLINSTVSGNIAPYGGGIDVENTTGSSTLTLYYSTISGNSALIDGGGIRKSNPESTINLAATIIASNTAVSAPDCSGSINSNDYNLIQNITGCTVSGLSAHNLIGPEPNLGPLKNNGGSTKTHSLLPGSPAIEAGGVDCPPPMTDQRGITRPQGLTCDIGAYELLLLSLGKTVQLSNDPIQPGDPLTYTIVVVNNGTGNALGVVVSDTLPAYIEGTDLYALENITANTSLTFTLNVTLSPSAPLGEVITNTAFLFHASDSDQDDAVFTVTDPPHLAITKTVQLSNNPIQAGDPLTYTIVVANLGAGNASKVAVTDTMPTYINGLDLNQTVDITAGESVTFTLNVTLSKSVPLGEVITNTAFFSHTSGSNQASSIFSVNKMESTYLPVILKN